jgi:hypothetical protein
MSLEQLASSWLARAGVRPRVADRVASIVGAVWSVAQAPARRAAESRRPPEIRVRTLPCDLHLTLGAQSVTLFPAGPIDDLRVFQRRAVAESSEVEWVTRLDRADAGTENYKAWGIVRLRGEWQRLPELDRNEGFWEWLRQEHGLETIPTARAVVRADLTAWEPGLNEPAAGSHRIAPPRSTKLWRSVGQRRVTHGDVVEIIRRGLDGLHKIAWMESAFAPAVGAVVHRYYLDGAKQLWLVRDHARDGKRLYRATTSPEALAAAASGAVPRMRLAG